MVNVGYDGSEHKYHALNNVDDVYQAEEMSHVSFGSLQISSFGWCRISVSSMSREFVGFFVEVNVNVWARRRWLQVTIVKGEGLRNDKT